MIETKSGMAKKAGIGSFFHTEEGLEASKMDISAITRNHQLFYTGRQALLFLIKMLSETTPINRIWLPEYYCKHVTAWLEENLDTIAFYNINPFEQEGTLNFEEMAAPNDIVILNNYWGVFEYGIERKPNAPIYIEDHTHGWLSEGCMKSKADYCFASLRKSLPIPMGGICWKPNGVLPAMNQLATEDQHFYPIWEQSQRAMALKSRFIKGVDRDIEREDFLHLFSATEAGLNANFNLVAMKEEHKAIIGKYLDTNYLDHKKRNRHFLRNNLNPNNHFKILDHHSKTTFGLQVLFQEEQTYLDFRDYLIQHQIYPSTLWPGNKKEGLWHHMLNIHIDFRYSLEDMAYLTTCINNWQPQKRYRLN
jgi:hypothetical protein